MTIIGLRCCNEKCEDMRWAFNHMLAIYIAELPDIVGWNFSYSLWFAMVYAAVLFGIRLKCLSRVFYHCLVTIHVLVFHLVRILDWKSSCHHYQIDNLNVQISIFFTQFHVLISLVLQISYSNTYFGNSLRNGISLQKLNNSKQIIVVVICDTK